MTIEEILPTKTISPAGRSVVTAYNVVTHTSTITDHQAAAQQDNNRNILQGLFQGLLPSNRWAGNFSGIYLMILISTSQVSCSACTS